MIENIFRQKNLHDGRMIGFSKSGYTKSFPNNEVYFNARIFTEELGKIWVGDIDVTVNSYILQEIANESQLDLFIISESDSKKYNDELVFEDIKRLSKRFYLYE
jgi:hypothetical protein